MSVFILFYFLIFFFKKTKTKQTTKKKKKKKKNNNNKTELCLKCAVDLIMNLRTIALSATCGLRASRGISNVVTRATDARASRAEHQRGAVALGFVSSISPVPLMGRHESQFENSI